MAKKYTLETFETKEVLLRIQGWARDGLTEAQIAENLDVSYATFRRYKKASEQIQEALKNSKDIADRNVENALYKRAMGYDYDEVTSERKLNADTGQHELMVTKIIHKHVLPDVTAQIFWLKNRKPEEWRDKRIVEDHLDFADDGFIDAVKGDAGETFKDSDGTVEE